MTKDMTTGSPMKLVLSFAIPLMFGNLFQQFYSMVDTIIVGRFLGTGPLAAVGSTGSINFLILGFCTGICAGFTIPVSQSYGAKDFQDLKRFVGNILWLASGFTLVITVLTVALCRPILQWMDTPADILDDAYSYIVVIFLGIPTIVLYNVLASLLRALGDSKTPLYAIVVAALMNVALDLLFVVGFHWDIAGAAIATVSAQLISTLGCFAYAFSKYPELRLHQEDWQITCHDVTRHLIQGIPLGLQFSVLAIGIIVVQSIVVQFDMLNGVMVSNSAQNGFGAANKINNLLMTPLNGLGSAMTSFTAQNLGAGDTKRIKKGTIQSIIIMLIMAACSILIGLLLTIDGTYLRIFLSADKVTAETLRFGNSYLYIDLSLYAFLGFIFVARNCVQGIGKPQFVLGAGAAELVARAAACGARGRRGQRGGTAGGGLRFVRGRSLRVDRSGRRAVYPVYQEHHARKLRLSLRQRPETH